MFELFVGWHKNMKIDVLCKRELDSEVMEDSKAINLALVVAPEGDLKEMCKHLCVCLRA